MTGFAWQHPMNAHLKILKTLLHHQLVAKPQRICAANNVTECMRSAMYAVTVDKA